MNTHLLTVYQNTGYNTCCHILGYFILADIAVNSDLYCNS